MQLSQQKPVVRARGLSKQYRVRSLDRELWALRDVSFTIGRGEVLGIVGGNGAGKSTLLKIMSGIASPTRGSMSIRGSVNSILELTCGFHGELTGTENVYLYGTLLGMRRAEIKRQFHSIVTFAELRRFMQMPVKYYSSGMKLRLAFAVAVHRRADVLIIDEVLSVGDTSFRQKCLDEIERLAADGCTIIITSHNVRVLARLCPRMLLLDEGKLKADGSSDEVMNVYLKPQEEAQGEVQLPQVAERAIAVRRVAVVDGQGRTSGKVQHHQEVGIEIDYEVTRPVSGAHVFCVVMTQDGVVVFGTRDADCAPEVMERTREPGQYRAAFSIPAGLLQPGWYFLTVFIEVPWGESFDRHDHVVSFEVVREQTQSSVTLSRRGVITLSLPWEVTCLTESPSDRYNPMHEGQA